MWQWQDAAEAWRRVKAQFQLQSPLFRHAVRLAVALLAGFGLMTLTNDQHGYWIVLTLIVVGAARTCGDSRRSRERLLGNVLGLAISASLNAPIPETRFGVFRM